MTAGGIMLASYALTVIARGPLEHHKYLGGDGFLGGTSTGVYFNNTFGGIFSIAIPIGLLVLVIWYASRRLRLPEGLTISTCLYFLPSYVAYLWIMMWEW